MPRKTAEAAAELGEQFARLAGAPTSEKRVSDMTDDEVRQLAGAMPAEQTAAKRWNARASLTLTSEQKQALDMARAIDGIPDTARIRAMITLWQEDARIRSRIDKIARSRDA